MKRMSWLLIVPLLLAAAAAPVACVENLEFTLAASSSSSTTSSTGGMGGGGAGSGGMMNTSTGGMGGTGGTGGTGGALECMTVSDCKSGECKTPKACTDGVCVWTYTPNGTPAESQLYGDCQDRLCDGQGNLKLANTSDDPTQWYLWNNPCYADACNATAMPMANEMAMCTTPWNKAGKCDGFNCVECKMNEDCGSGACSPDGRCVLPTCTDAALTPGESDVDCGGLNCAPCGMGKACMSDADCTGKCENMICSAPSCSDGILNQDETAVDCGGICAMEMPPKKCMDFKKCLFPRDCISESCAGGQCKEPSCLDQIKNQDEQGIDCGGICPLSCQ